LSETDDSDHSERQKQLQIEDEMKKLGEHKEIEIRLSMMKVSKSLSQYSDEY